MKKILTSGIAALALVLAGCGADSSQFGNAQAAAKPSASAQLNLSHIECVSATEVVVHFVLLFAGDVEPGPLSFTYSNGTASATVADIAPEKNSGNVWHYNAYLPAGYIDVTSATTTTSSGATVNLHNPSAYAQDYAPVCAPPPPPPVCDVTLPTDQPWCPADGVIGNEQDECAAFGLDVISKDEIPLEIESPTHEASVAARLAIVKAGTCYTLYENVVAGDELATADDKAVSHVTYCKCSESTPPPAQ